MSLVYFMLKKIVFALYIYSID